MKLKILTLWNKISIAIDLICGSSLIISIFLGNDLIIKLSLVFLIIEYIGRDILKTLNNRKKGLEKLKDDNEWKETWL